MVVGENPFRDVGTRTNKAGLMHKKPLIGKKARKKILPALIASKWSEVPYPLNFDLKKKHKDISSLPLS
jgi:hypothetical protein